MTTDQISYKRGYYYQLVEDYSVMLPELRGAVTDGFRVLTVGTREVGALASTGLLTARAGYCWDGASGPAFDTHTIMRASLAHDELYQFCRAGYIGPEWREACDNAFRRMCIEDDMWTWRANYVHRGVRLGGGPSADPANRRPVLVSPPRVLVLPAA